MKSQLRTYFLRLQKRDSEVKEICKLFDRNGTEISGMRDVMRVVNRNLGRKFRLSAELVLFGSKKSGVLVNLLILLAKQYIVNRKLKCEALLTNVFWIHVKRQYEV